MCADLSPPIAPTTSPPFLFTYNCTLPLCPKLFSELWNRRCPIIVRGTKGRVAWTPDVMKRACRDIDAKKRVENRTKGKEDVVLKVGVLFFCL